MMATNPNFEQAQELQWQGRYAEALGYYKRALQIEPNNGSIYYEMAISLTHLGMKDDAKEAVEKAKALDPEIAKEIEAQHLKVQAQKILRQAEDSGQLEEAGPLLDAIRKGYLSFTDAKQKLSFGVAFARSTAPQLMDALDDELWYVRMLALEWVERLGYKGAIPKLTSLLCDPNDIVRIAAIDAAKAYMDKSLIPMLEAVAQNDAKGSVQDAAIAAMDYLNGIEVTVEQAEEGWLVKGTRPGGISSVQRRLWE